VQILNSLAVGYIRLPARNVLYVMCIHQVNLEAAGLQNLVPVWRDGHKQLVCTNVDSSFLTLALAGYGLVSAQAFIRVLRQQCVATQSYFRSSRSALRRLICHTL
jgi:hypothetical protein